MSPMIVNPSRFGGGGGAGYGWAPDDISGLLFWWRADAPDNVIHDDGFGNDIVTTFTDQSGNANHGTWTSARATLVSNVTGNLPAALFPGGALFLYNLPSTTFSGVTAAQVFAAIKCASNTTTGTGTNDSGLFDFSYESGTAFGGHYPWSDGNIYDTFGSATRFSVANPGGLDSWHRLSIKAEAAGYAMYKNNVSILSNGTSCGSHWTSSPVPTFGGRQVGLSDQYRFNGHLLEIFCYDSVLSSGDRGTADQYLADRIDGTWYAAENP